MIVTADERRNVLNLFNVSEAARQLGIAVQQMHRDIKAGRLPSPQVRVGRRLYFTRDDLDKLMEQFHGIKPK
ncbi:Helix-turn-helix domain protein [Symmachiella dynata]|nr:Helix-turn-helix domain protein [Symmachiella dynata]